MPEKLFERVRALFEMDDLTIDEQKPALARMGRSVGWDDLATDVYIDL
jgi:hypothetical protein